MTLEEFKKVFFKDTDDTGRFVVISSRTGIQYYVEPVDPRNNAFNPRWGDLNPATGNIEGGYGLKNKGSVTAKESIVNEENGLINVVTLPPGQSPYGYINDIDEKRYQEQQNK